MATPAYTPRRDFAAIILTRAATDDETDARQWREER